MAPETDVLSFRDDAWEISLDVDRRFSSIPTDMAAKTDEIYRRILDRLAGGAMVAGDRVSEQSLAQELAVSRTPVREAVKRLQADGYLDQVHRYGTVVREPDLQEVAEAYDLREAIETHVAAHTPPERFAAVDGELAGAVEALEEVAVELASLPIGADRSRLVARQYEVDSRFHALLVGCGGNRRFASLVDHARLFARINGVRRHAQVTFDVVMGIQREHADVLSHLRAGNGAAAADALRRHIRHSKAGALDWLRLQHRIERAGG